MSIPHAEIIEEASHRICAQDGVLGVMLFGSIARGAARPDSDVDLIAVVAEPGEAVLVSFSIDGVGIECVRRTSGEWLNRLQRPQPRWVYAFLEGEVLCDSSGVVRRLVVEAQHRSDTYRTPAEVVSRLLDWWRVILPRQRAALAQGDPLQMGFAAGFSSDLFEALYAANDRPWPPGRLMLERLNDLSDPPDALTLIRTWLTDGSAQARLQSQIQIIESTLPLLQARLTSVGE